MNIKWDASKYAKDFKFVHKYGEDVIELFNLPCGSSVIDLGCGNGNLTVKLKEKGYNVIGIDDSEDMLKIARENYSDIKFIKGNALDFRVEPVDGIFSNAVLHWIDKERHQELLNNISANIKNGGEFVCEFGGYGCAETVHSALKDIFNKRGYKYFKNFYFPTIGEYAPLLEKAGFIVKYALLFDRPTLQVGEKGLESWIRMFNMAPFKDISEDETQEIIDEAADALKPVLCKNGSWYVDYVRIRFRCIKEQTFCC